MYLPYTGQEGVNPTFWVEEAPPLHPCWACSNRCTTIKAAQVDAEEEGCVVGELPKHQTAGAGDPENQAAAQVPVDARQQPELLGTMHAKVSGVPKGWGYPTHTALRVRTAGELNWKAQAPYPAPKG